MLTSHAVLLCTVYTFMRVLSPRNHGSHDATKPRNANKSSLARSLQDTYSLQTIPR